MKNVVQNREMFQFIVERNTTEFRFPKNFSLNGRFINRMYVYRPNNGFRGLELEDVWNIDVPFLHCISVTLKNKDNKDIIKNVPLEMFFRSEKLGMEINEVIDWEKSFFRYDRPLDLWGSAIATVLVAFEYESMPRSPIRQWENAISFEFPTNRGFMRLTDRIGTALEGKKITKVRACSTGGRWCLMDTYINLVDTSGKIIKDSLTSLSDSPSHIVSGPERYLENFSVDKAKSYIWSSGRYATWVPEQHEIILTFYYYE